MGLTALAVGLLTAWLSSNQNFRLGHHSNLTRQGSYCKWHWRQRPIYRQCAENKSCWSTQCYVGCLCDTLSLVVQGPKQKRTQKDNRSQGWWWLQRQEEFSRPNRAGAHTNSERLDSMHRTCTSSSQTKSQLRADGHIVPPWQRCCMQLTAARTQWS